MDAVYLSLLAIVTAYPLLACVVVRALWQHYERQIDFILASLIAKLKPF